MSEKYLIALDLDGTLLSNKKIISLKTKQIINTIRSLGHIVVIATGRPFRASKLYYNEMNLDTPIVNFNGAYVHHPTQTSWGAYHSPLELKIAKTIVEACESFTVKNILAEVIDDVYLHYDDKTLKELITFGNPLITTGSLHQFLKSDPTSILIHAKADTVDKIRTHLTDVHAEVIDHRNWGAPWHVIEVVRTGLNKAVGLKRIANYYGIPKQRIIAFGDEDNDLEMLEFAGKGVAMGNAITAVKNIANDMTKSNEEEGIALYLQDYFNLKTT